MPGGPSLDSWAICGFTWMHRFPKVMHSPEVSVPHGTPCSCSSDPWLPYRSTPCPRSRMPYTASLPHWMLKFLTDPSHSHSGPQCTLHPHLCARLSFPYGLRVSRIPPTPLHLFYTGPSCAQWARIQEEGQGKEQGPVDVWGKPGVQEAPLTLMAPKVIRQSLMNHVTVCVHPLGWPLTTLALATCPMKGRIPGSFWVAGQDLWFPGGGQDVTITSGAASRCSYNL